MTKAEELQQTLDELKKTKAQYDAKIEQLEIMNEKFKKGLKVLDNMKQLYADSLSELMDHKQ